MQPVTTSFQSELERLEKTYHWAITEAPVAALTDFCRQSIKTPLLSVGSGGSLTVAAYAAMMHQTQGMVARPITPLELYTMGPCIPGASLLFPSAGGKNVDVMTAAQFAVQHQAQHMLAMCGCFNSPLAQLVQQYPLGSALEFEIPTGKDGFLATVSLIAFCAILLKAYNQAYGNPWTMPTPGRLFALSFDAMLEAAQPLFGKQTWMMLCGSWGLPVAMDAESKLTESTLMSNRMIDYRNVAHGHYQWLAQHKGTTGVVALITPFEKDIAETTLSHLPPEIPQVKLVTQLLGPAGTLDLMLQLIALVDALGQAKGWSPAQMAGADFGKTLQQWQYSIPAFTQQGNTLSA